jgi:hypothetical protein
MMMHASPLFILLQGLAVQEREDSLLKDLKTRLSLLWRLSDPWDALDHVETLPPRASLDVTDRMAPAQMAERGRMGQMGAMEWMVEIEWHQYRAVGLEGPAMLE